VDDIELDLHIGRAPVLLVNPAPLPLDLDSSLLDGASMMLWKLLWAERVRTGHLTLLRNEHEAQKRGSSGEARFPQRGASRQQNRVESTALRPSMAVPF
jgi:hypothetical protein